MNSTPEPDYSWHYLAQVTLYSGQSTYDGSQWVLAGLCPITNLNQQAGSPPQVQIGCNWSGFGGRSLIHKYTLNPAECWEEHDMPIGSWSYSAWLCVSGENHGWIYTIGPTGHPSAGRMFKIELVSFTYSSPYPATLNGYEQFTPVEPTSLGGLKALFKGD